MEYPLDFEAGQPVLRFWKCGIRRDITATRFWGLVAAQMRRIEQQPAGAGISIILDHTSPDQITLFLALIACGRLAAMFPPSNSIQDEQAYLTQQRESLRKIDPACIYIFDRHTYAILTTIDPVLGQRGIHLAAEPEPLEHEAHAARARFLERLTDPGPIFVQHSSGTTGIKKSVAITGHALAEQYAAYWPMIRDMTGSDLSRIVSWLPLYHDMGLLTSLLLPVIGGDCVSIVDPFEWIGKPGLLFDMIEQDECQIAWMPNFALRHLVRLSGHMNQRDLGTMRAWVNCSEPCRLADALGFEKAFADWGVAASSVIGCYAMAETVFAATQCRPDSRVALAASANLPLGSDVRLAGSKIVHDMIANTDRHVLSSGRAIPGLDLIVLVSGQPAGEGIYGEFAVKGPSMFGGYAAMSPAESNITADGYFKTGDLGVIIDGHAFVLGRSKEMLIVNGKNLFAGDVEAIVGGIAGVKAGRVVAIGMESAQTGSEELIIVSEHDLSAGRDVQSVRADVSRTVSEHFLVVPRDVRVVEERWLVKSTSGKVSRSENAAKYIATFRKRSSSAA